MDGESQGGAGPRRDSGDDGDGGAGVASAATVGQLAAAWGSNDNGQLGNGTSGGVSNVPVGIGGGLNATNVQALAGGNHHSLAK